MRGRKGTKSNPFSLGESVVFKKSGDRGIVVGVHVEDHSGARIFYLVRLLSGGQDRWGSARDLEPAPSIS